jgi:hypothetical protein
MVLLRWQLNSELWDDFMCSQGGSDENEDAGSVVCVTP